MHADKLYHQMLDYEERVKEAKAAGTEPPPLMSLFHPEKSPKSQPTTEDKSELAFDIPGGQSIPAGFKPSKPLHTLTPHERELEIRAFNSQMEQQRLYAEEASPFMKSQTDARTKRQEVAVSWFGETIGKWLS